MLIEWRVREVSRRFRGKTGNASKSKFKFNHNLCTRPTVYHYTYTLRVFRTYRKRSVVYVRERVYQVDVTLGDHPIHGQSVIPKCLVALMSLMTEQVHDQNILVFYPFRQWPFEVLWKKQSHETLGYWFYTSNLTAWTLTFRRNNDVVKHACIDIYHNVAWIRWFN